MDMRRGTRRPVGASAIVIGMALVAAACTTSSTPRTSGSGSAGTASSVASIAEQSSGYTVAIDPADFVDTVDHPFFPLQPGSGLRLEGRTDQGREVDTITVLEETRKVMGVTATVVLDVVKLNGSLVEKTWDWFAQDREGNVWYFGEDTAEYEDGKIVSHAGAWEAGVDGALPGIVMPAEPKATDSYRQEYYRGEAEDMFWVVATGVSKDTPYGHFDDAIHTLEWTPLEPRIVVEKFHAPGVGLIAERALSGGAEIFELVEVRRP